MNKLFVSILFAAFLFSCKSSAPSANQSSSLDRSSQSGLKGNWEVTNVSFPGSDYLKINSFQIADSKCFINSTWNFVPNNNKGSINLNSAGCPSFNSDIIWSINKDGSFWLKFISPETKSKAVTQGYLLRLANQTENSFQLIDVVNIGGQKKDLVYQFQKIN